MASGTSVARLIPIAATPILTRIFLPEAFGVVGLFLSITALLSIVSTGKYELAIVSPKLDQDAINLLALIMAISISLFVLLCFIVLLFSEPLAAWLDRSDFPVWLLYAVPFMILLEGGRQGIYSWFIRHKRFKIMAVSDIGQSSSIVASNIALALSGVNLLGMIFGNIIGRIVGTGILLRRFFLEDYHFLKDISVKRMISVGRTFRNFPKYMMLSNGIANFYSQLPLLFLASQYGLELAGFYSLAYRLVFMPSGLVGTAIKNVFRQKAQEEFNKHGRFDGVFLQVLQKTVLVSVVPTVVFLIFAPDIFALILGEPWRIAGEYARIISIASFVSFFNSPLTASALVTGQTGYLLKWDTSMLISNLLLVGLVWYFSWEIVTYLWLAVAVRVFHYLVDLVIEYQFAQGKTVRWL